MNLIPKVIPGKRCKRTSLPVRGLPFESVTGTHGHVGDPRSMGVDQYYICNGDVHDKNLQPEAFTLTPQGINDHGLPWDEVSPHGMLPVVVASDLPLVGDRVTNNVPLYPAESANVAQGQARGTVVAHGYQRSHLHVLVAFDNVACDHKWQGLAWLLPSEVKPVAYEDAE